MPYLTAEDAKERWGDRAVLVSAQVIAVDAPAQVDSRYAAEAAEHETGHESHVGSDPPAHPPQDGHAKKNAEPVHVLSPGGPTPSGSAPKPSRASPTVSAILLWQMNM
jgi:hypothetical protein